MLLNQPTSFIQTLRAKLSERGSALQSDREVSGAGDRGSQWICRGRWLRVGAGVSSPIASPRASFSLPEIKLGFFRGTAAQRLAREIGEAARLRSCLTEERLSAKKLCDLVWSIASLPTSELLAEAESLARRDCTIAPLAIRACLEAVTRGMELPLAEGLALEAELFAGLFATDDMREGTRAFWKSDSQYFKGDCRTVHSCLSHIVSDTRSRRPLNRQECPVLLQQPLTCRSETLHLYSKCLCPHA